jgi:ribosomal-protein-alanine N-acetyltransferase
VLFETSRLVIGHLQAEHLEHFVALQADPEVAKYTGYRMTNREKIVANFWELLSYYGKPKPFFYIWAVCHKETGEFLGTCALIKNEKQETEIGFRLLKAHWGKGYTSELAPALFAYSFEEYAPEKIVAYAFKDNIASCKILDKEMTFVKEFYNEEEKLWDRAYVLSQENYKKRKY